MALILCICPILWFRFTSIVYSTCSYIYIQVPFVILSVLMSSFLVNPLPTSVTSVLVVGLSITCIVIKWMFFVWLHHLEKKLNSYLHSFDNKLESSNRVIPQVNRSTIWEGIPLDPPPPNTLSSSDTDKWLYPCLVS